MVTGELAFNMAGAKSSVNLLPATSQKQVTQGWNLEHRIRSDENNDVKSHHLTSQVPRSTPHQRSTVGSRR